MKFNAKRAAGLMLFTVALLLMAPSAALAQDGSGGEMGGLHYFGAAVGGGIVVVGAGIGIGRLAAAAAEGIARQPQAAKDIQAAVPVASLSVGRRGSHLSRRMPADHPDPVRA